MADETTPCNLEDIQSAFVDSPKYILPTITDALEENKEIFTSFVPRGNFDYGNGYNGYLEEFYGGLGIQDGGASWGRMAPYRAPGTNGPTDAGYDPCKSSALIVNYGILEKSWTIYQAERRTEDICLTDALFKWHLAETLALRYKALAEVSIFEWEQILSRAYETFCDKRIARLDNTASGLAAFTLTPDTGASFGGSIAIPAGGLGVIGVLNQSVLDRVYSYLVRAVKKDGFIGMNGTIPLIGVAASQETLGDVIKQDASIVSALNWAMPQINIEGYGPMHTFKNWVWMNDWNAVRYQPNAAGTRLVAVYPKVATATATIGDLFDVDPDYLNAPFETVRIMLRNVFEADVPPPNPASIGEYKFNPTNNIMDWEFMNIQERCENPRREKGFFLARARMAPKPLRNSRYALEILVRRCIAPTITECTCCTNVSTVNVLTVTANDSTIAAATEKEWNLTTDGCLDVQVGDRIVLTETAPATPGAVYGIVSNNFCGTTFMITLDTAADYSGLTAGTIAATTSAHNRG